MSAVARLIASLSSILAPRDLRARWREEWNGELAAAARVSGLRALRLSLGAPFDALSSRWTTRLDQESGLSGLFKGAGAADFKQTMRGLLRSPGHVLTVSLCLGVGIAVTTTTFSILNAFMYGPRPGIEDRATLPRMYVYGSAGSPDPSLEEFAVIREKSPGIEAIAAEGRFDFSIRVPGREPMHVVGAFVNGEFFQALRSRPYAGRLLGPADDQRDAPLAVVISHTFWAARLGSPAGIVGRTIVIGDRDAVVVGIAPEGFTGLASDDVDGPGGFKVYVPLAHATGWPNGRAPNRSWLNMAARLRGPLDESAFTAGLQPIAAKLEGMNPQRRKEARIVAVANGLAPGTGNVQLMAMFVLMLSAPFTVLAIGCANVANLQLVRASLRSRELAVRASIGASRGQIVRLLTLEAGLLMGGACAAAALLIALLLKIAALVIPVPVGIEWRVLLFSAAVAIVVIAATGLLPALAATRGRTADGLRAGGRSIAGGNSRIRRGLVIAQVTLCFLLLLAAAVFTRGLIGLTWRMPAQATSITVAEIRFDLRNYSAAERRRLMDEFASRLRADSRVANVGLTSSTPDPNESWRFWLDADAPEIRRYTPSNHVSPGFFDTAGMRILRGRTFRPGVLTEIIVDEAFVREQQLAEPVLGRTIKVEAEDSTVERPSTRMATIVGVASPPPGPTFFGEAEPTMYLPLVDAPPRYVGVWVRSVENRDLTEVARQALAAVDPALPPLAIRPLRSHYDEEFAPLTHIARTAAGLGSVALVLAVSGVYSVIAFFVALRTNEFGIRMALGARASDIVRMVLGQAARLVGVGLIAGAILGTPLLMALNAFFPFTQAFDPLVILPTILALTLTALIASWVPARRASSIEASVALRAE